jgi:hypothetical protein
MAAPATPPRPLVIYVGDTLSFTVTSTTDGVTPVDITGRTYACKIRASADASTVLATATCQVTTAAGGEVTVSIPATTTDDLTPGVAVADLEETNGGTVTTLVRWRVEIVQDVTR